MRRQPSPRAGAREAEEVGQREESIVKRYVEHGEDVLLAFSAYLGLGLRRCVVGVTTCRLLLIKSRYSRFWGDRHSADDTIAKLYSLVANRF